MEIALAILSVIVAVGLLTTSATMVTRANEGNRVPYFTNAERTPARSLVLRAAGALFVLIGAGVLSSEISYWSAAVVVAAFLPGTALIVLHNQKVASYG